MIAALTAVLALGSLPGLVGSRQPSPSQPINPAAFREIILAANGGRSTPAAMAADPAYASASRLDPTSTFAGPSSTTVVAPSARVSVAIPPAPTNWAWKTPRYTMTGSATFYDNGTTAMRLPRGTVIVICGASGCIERVVNDYGPIAGTSRILDMYRPDFFSICGCAWWSGVIPVTVRVY